MNAGFVFLYLAEYPLLYQIKTTTKCWLPLTGITSCASHYLKYSHSLNASPQREESSGQCRSGSSTARASLCLSTGQARALYHDSSYLVELRPPLLPPSEKRPKLLRFDERPLEKPES
jgi:hypothetical protein